MRFVSIMAMASVMAIAVGVALLVTVALGLVSVEWTLPGAWTAMTGIAFLLLANLIDTWRGGGR